MMNTNAKNVYKPGSLITWGSGSIVARVVKVDSLSETVTFELTRDERGPCGQVFENGTKSALPLCEVRCVN